MNSSFEFKDYYMMLDLERDAAVSVIKSSFRQMAKATHPDTAMAGKGYEQFVLIREAYDVLTDKVKKKKYDQLWDIYHKENTNSYKDNDYFSEVLHTFGENQTDFYKDEWEYFVLHPESYLRRFGNILTLFLATAITFLTGIFIPFTVTVIVFASVILFAVIFLFFVFSLSKTFLSIIVAAALFLMMIVRIRSKFRIYKVKAIKRVVKVVLYPLRGIPIQKGKWILYSFFIMSYLIMIRLGYELVSITNYEILTELTGSGSNGMHLILLMAVIFVLVIIFSFCGIILFEIIYNGIKHYPRTVYLKMKVRKQPKISYIKEIQ